jgi:hypothetical protein
VLLVSLGEVSPLFIYAVRVADCALTDPEIYEPRFSVRPSVHAFILLYCLAVVPPDDLAGII